MSETEKEEFRKILQQLDAAILAKAPKLHANLSPPASEAEIASFRKAKVLKLITWN